MEFLWAGGITCIKLSILLFYTKIFAVRKFIIAAKAAACLVVAWCISKSLRDTVVSSANPPASAVCMVDFFICRPFAFNWDSTIPGGKCGNTILGFQLLGTMNLVTDMVILLLPQPYIWTLHLPLAKRIALALTFLVGIT